MRYRRFPLFSTWAGIANTAGTQLPPLLFAFLFSPAAAGMYALSNRALQMPMNLIGAAIGQVFFANASEAQREGTLGLLVEQVHDRLAHIGLPPAALILIVGPDLFAFVFGSTWREAGEFARYMALWLYLVFVSSPLSTVFLATENQQQALISQLILLVLRVVVIAFGAWIGDLMLTVFLFASVSAICYLGLLFWVAHIAGSEKIKIVSSTFSAACVALVCSVPVLTSLIFSAASSSFWIYAMFASLLLITARFCQLIKNAY